ncbi:hypothetical protein E2C01_039578 [Portunus trituberculatus]|uniref:Uncharacterized protein n=1 Tax=Portunus trituberculatus TaxID=210409 RepID=A0A5B7FH73_PORTR|nr:hypothetical protein [Portunus trituberculatus]
MTTSLFYRDRLHVNIYHGKAGLREAVEEEEEEEEEVEQKAERERGRGIGGGNEGGRKGGAGGSGAKYYKHWDVERMTVLGINRIAPMRDSRNIATPCHP